MKTINDKVINLFESNNGFLELDKLKSEGVNSYRLKSLVENNIIEKIKPGLYRLVDFEFDNYIDYISICRANPLAVICNISALSYYELTTQNSFVIEVAIPNDRKPIKIINLNIKYHYLRESSYSLGIDEIKTDNGAFKIYSIEKTLCDIMRNRKRLGEDVVIEAMKLYMSRNDKDVNRLYECSKICRIEKSMFQYIKILAG